MKTWRRRSASPRTKAGSPFDRDDTSRASACSASSSALAEAISRRSSARGAAPAPGCRPAKQQQVVDQPDEAVGLALDGGEEAIACVEVVHRAIAQRLGQPLDRGERRAQLVTDVGDQVRAGLEGAAQLVAHRAEGACEAGELLGRGGGERILEIAAGQAVRRDGQVADGPGNGTRQHQPDQRRQHQGDRGGDCQAAAQIGQHRRKVGQRLADGDHAGDQAIAPERHVYRERAWRDGALLAARQRFREEGRLDGHGSKVLARVGHFAIRQHLSRRIDHLDPRIEPGADLKRCAVDPEGGWAGRARFCACCWMALDAGGRSAWLTLLGLRGGDAVSARDTRRA